MTKLMDDKRIKKFTPLEFKNLPRYPNGDLHVDFWNEDFIWLTDHQKTRISGDDQARLFDYEEEMEYLMAEDAPEFDEDEWEETDPHGVMRDLIRENYNQD